MLRCLLLSFGLCLAMYAASGKDLLSSKDLSNWEPRGDAIWRLRSDGVLVGQRKPPSADAPKPSDPTYRTWFYKQAWIYTKAEFESFDLTLDYWLPMAGNSGISIRDTSRAENAISEKPDFTKTPSRIAYEIQLNNNYPDKYPSASIYNFVAAKTGMQRDLDWNTLRIESRPEHIRVYLNGVLAAEHPGDPNRAKRGPIGLQLHDQKSIVMFRNIRIKEK